MKHEHDFWMVIHHFDMRGSAIIGWDKENDEQGRYLLGRCIMLARPPLQVVKLGGRDAPEIYAEYCPYTYIEDEQKLLNMCIYGETPSDIFESWEDFRNNPNKFLEMWRN